MIKKIIKAVNVVFGNFVRVQSRLSFDEARKYLQEISPKPKGTCYTKNKLAIQYDLHIIIPAYNAEKYIKEARPKITEDTENALFVNSLGQRFTRQGLWKLIKKYASIANINKNINYNC